MFLINCTTDEEGNLQDGDMLERFVTIEALNTPEKFKEALRLLLEEISRCSKINQIIVFGSVAKGTANKKSDIDLCILSDEDEFTVLTDSEVNNAFLRVVEKGMNIHFDVLVYNTIGELKDAYENTFMSIEKSIYQEGITVFKKQ